MSKTIWRFNQNPFYGYGKISLDKLTVVYENKTYYYCKASGSDDLEKFTKERVDTNSNFIISINGSEREHIEQLFSTKFGDLKKRRLYAEIDMVAGRIGSCTRELDQLRERAEELEDIRMKEGF